MLCGRVDHACTALRPICVSADRMCVVDKVPIASSRIMRYICIMRIVRYIAADTRLPTLLSGMANQ